MSALQMAVCSTAWTQEGAGPPPSDPRPRRPTLLRPLKLQHELIHRRGVAEHDIGPGILRMAQEVAFRNELESRCLYLLSQRLLSDPVILLADGGAIFGQRRMIGN